MAGTGMCCGSLEETKALMKMGLSMVLVGHVNFLLGALVHGVVLRHINLHKQARAMEYAVSNVFAMTSGLVGIVVGILAIVLSKNKKSRGLSTTLILWIPLIVICVIQTVFSARCSAVCVSFLGLLCCPVRRKSRNFSKSINVVRPITEVVPETRPPTRNSEAVTIYIDPATRYAQPPRRQKQQQQQPQPQPQPQQRPSPPPLPPPKRLPPQHRSLPPSERQPRPQQRRERSSRPRQERRDGSQRRMPEQQHLLDRGTLERSSFWI